MKRHGAPASRRRHAGFSVYAVYAVGALGPVVPATGCVSDELVGDLSASSDEPPPLPAAPPLTDVALRIEQIRLQGVTDESGLLEIELHLFDADSGGFLGCAGAIQGLVSVDQSGILYAVDAHFVRPGTVAGYPAPRRDWLTKADVLGKNLTLLVTEDDTSACPGLHGQDDDLLDESGPFHAEALGSPLTMKRGLVTALKIRVP